MATTKQHNEIIKVILDGSKHLKHVMTNEEIQKMTIIENRYPLSRMPVCGNCEKLGMWSRQSDGTIIGICKSCGGITKNPITYSTYLASGYDVDPTGATAKKVLKTQQEIREFILPAY